MAHTPSNWRSLLTALAVLSGLVAASSLRAADPAPAASRPAPAENPERSLNCPAKFIVSLASDNDGNLWVGTEDAGVYRYTPSKDQTAQGRWEQFTTGNGLGDDNAYALACDKLGRIWVGHLNHGVSVYNGQKWQNYNVIQGLSREGISEKNDPTPALAGPLGSRVFAIVASPIDGDIWISTECGLARYSLKTDTWSYITRASGLPSDQVATLVFSKTGVLFAGTQCDGIGIANPTDNYTKWKVVRGPDQLVATPTGSGLPTSLINNMLVTSTGNIYAATPTGLAWSSDGGDSWQYGRGKDYVEKARGLLHPIGGTLPTPAQSKSLLTEDFVTQVSEDSAGRLWLGHRATGYEVIDPKIGTVFSSKNNPALAKLNGYVTIILHTPGKAYIGRYGDGLSQLLTPTPKPGDAKQKTTPDGLFLIPEGKDSVAGAEPSPTPDSAARPPLPFGAKPPTEDDLKAQLTKIQALPKTNVTGVFLGDDWNSQGDWLGKYCQQGGILCGAGAPADHGMILNGPIKIDSEIGPHKSKGDSVRLWIHAATTDNPRSLYDPVVGHRRQSEWDDHGEAYPATFEGPDLWIKVTVPEGLHRISLYFMNKDGHTQDRWSRDFLVTLKAAGRDYAETDASPTLARARVCNFWGGVYKQFAVGQAGSYFLKIERKYTFDTIVSAVFVDRLKGPANVNDGLGLPWLGRKMYVIPDPGPIPPSAGIALWSELDKSCDQNAVALASREARTLAYRSKALDSDAEKLLASWRSELTMLWTTEDRSSLASFERDAFDAEQKLERDSTAQAEKILLSFKAQGVPRFAPGLEQKVNPNAAENQKRYGP